MSCHTSCGLTHRKVTAWRTARKGAAGSGDWSLEPGSSSTILMAGIRPSALNTKKKIGLSAVGSEIAIMRSSLSVGPCTCVCV